MAREGSHAFTLALRGARRLATMSTVTPAPTVVEHAELIRSGEASAVELVERALRAIDGRNAQIGAFVALCADRALAEAARIRPDAIVRDAELRLEAYGRRLVADWPDDGILITPTLARLPAPVGSLASGTGVSEEA